MSGKRKQKSPGEKDLKAGGESSKAGNRGNDIPARDEPLLRDEDKEDNARAAPPDLLKKVDKGTDSDNDSSDEDVQEPSERLPSNWKIIRHESGVRIYMHKPSRVCTLSKPFFTDMENKLEDIPLRDLPVLDDVNIPNVNAPPAPGRNVQDRGQAAPAAPSPRVSIDYLAVFHEYVCMSLRKRPTTLIYKRNAVASLVKAILFLGTQRYGVGRGCTKREAKYAAIRSSMIRLLPEMQEFLENPTRCSNFSAANFRQRLKKRHARRTRRSSSHSTAYIQLLQRELSVLRQRELLYDPASAVDLDSSNSDSM